MSRCASMLHQGCGCCNQVFARISCQVFPLVLPSRRLCADMATRRKAPGGDPAPREADNLFRHGRSDELFTMVR
jgi:hypothetical protein